MEIDVEDAFQLAIETYHLSLKKRNEQCHLKQENSLLTGVPYVLPVLYGLSVNDYQKSSSPIINTNTSLDEDYITLDENYSSIDNNQTFDQSPESDSNIYFDDLLDEDGLQDYTEYLHWYTDVPTVTFCQRLARLFRLSHLSKQQQQVILDAIRGVLPIPNNLPSNMNQLLSLVQITKNLFARKKICILCNQDISTNGLCSVCIEADEAKIAIIYTSNIKYILRLLLTKVWNEIVDYKKQIKRNDDTTGDHDIGFGFAYRNLLNEFSDEQFITILLHLDGISLCKSNKLKLWLFSFSIVELPARIRYHRYNMPILSMWISDVEPIGSMWLPNIVKSLEELKTTGVDVNGQIVKVKVLGITGDLPALRIALNFVSHNGYYCCFFCYIHGVRRHYKQQYPYDCSVALRTAESFIQDAATAALVGQKEKGHHGISPLNNIFDIRLPYSIIIDYAHASLLRHSKSIFLEIYLRLTTVSRNDIDLSLTTQPFPHFFHRRMKSFKDLSFVKATEIRNTLFYAFVPLFHKKLPINLFTHFTLFISAMRLLHGRPVLGNATSNAAHKLLMIYYKDFPLFYEGLENIVLHYHSHFRTQYKLFGAFSHLGSFGQESLIGYMGSNHTGTRYQGDSIAENYSLDLVLHHKANDLHLFKETIDGLYDAVMNFDFMSNDILSKMHSSECSCTSINTCLKAFRRCKIRDRVYHSLIYKRRQKSVSYFVRYVDLNDKSKKSFGDIVMFLRVQNSNYALIKRYSIYCSMNDLLVSSPYHELLNNCIDHFFYVVKKDSCVYEPVHTNSIIDHCISFDCVDYNIVTPVSSYDEHN